MDSFTLQRGRFVRLQRLKQGWTQAKLASRIDMRADRLSRIERGQAPMMLSEWLRFCRVLGLERDGSKRRLK